MCGIVGIMGGNIDLLSSANNRQTHRGPDNSAIWIDVNHEVGLAHTRLSILDVSSHGHQPMQSSNGSIVLSYNGEIYNCESIRNSLVEKGFSFRGGSDTEVLLNLYLDEGVNLLPKLKGIFSFAIWDASKKSIFLARDALGVKPLYYAQTEKYFIFASEIKAILPLLLQCLSIDHKALQQYLTFLWSPGERSPVKEIKKLLPGYACY